MSLKVTFKHPDFPSEAEFDVIGLGLFKNGQAKTLSEEEEAMFVSLNGESVRDRLKGNEMFKVEGTSEVKAEGGDN